MTISEILPFLTHGTVLLITLVTLVDFLRHRDPARFDVFLMFGDLALIVLATWTNRALEQPLAWLSELGSILIMAHPYLLLRLVQHMRPVSLWVRAFALAGLVLSWVALILLPTPLPLLATVLMVVYFVFVEGYSVVALVRGSVSTSGVSQRRLLLAAIGSGLIGLVILIAGINAVFPPAAFLLTPLSQVVGLLALIAYFLGFGPPAWLRRSWQLSELHRFLLGTSGRWRRERIAEILSYLCTAAERAVGGIAAVVALWDPDEDRLMVRATSTQGQDYSEMLLDSPAIQHLWQTRRPALLRIPADFEITETPASAALQAARALLAVPISTQEQAWGLLLVFLLGRPLFASDDLSLLSLFTERTSIFLSYSELLADLEQRVIERTEQLEAAVENLELEIAARRKASEALRAAQVRLQFLLSATPAIIYSAKATSSFQTTFISENVRTQLGYEPEDFLNAPDFWFDHIHPEDLPVVQAKVLQVNQPDQVAFEYRFRQKDGTYVWMQDEYRLIHDAEGNPSEFVGYWIDITERKEAEEAVKRLNHDLQQRAFELKAANKELEAFAYSVSHDLRAPLRAIDGFSRILSTRYTSQLSPEALRYLGLVRENTLQMGQLIDDLLSFSRLSRQSLNKQPVQPVSLIRQVFRDLLKEQGRRQVDLIIHDLPSCQADPSLLKQVYVNLLSNALKFTSKKPAARIEVGCLNQNGEKVYYVRDNGVGFDMQYIGKLFGVFQRLHSSEEFQGTGVGLAIVQRIIHRHGGQVWAEAEVGQGATFYFSLPETVVETIQLPAPGM